MLSRPQSDWGSEREWKGNWNWTENSLLINSKEGISSQSRRQKPFFFTMFKWKPWWGILITLVRNFRGRWEQHFHCVHIFIRQTLFFLPQSQDSHTRSYWLTYSSISFHQNESCHQHQAPAARPHSKYWLVCWPAALRLQRRRAEAISADQRRRQPADVTEYAERLDNKRRGEAPAPPRRPNGPLGPFEASPELQGVIWPIRHNLKGATFEAFDWIKPLTYSKETTPFIGQ